MADITVNHDTEVWEHELGWTYDCSCLKRGRYWDSEQEAERAARAHVWRHIPTRAHERRHA